jgi:prepilin-type processing-associated H-X9-DG protein
MNYNQLNCETNRKNVGFGSCVVDLQIMKGFIFFDSPRSFTDDELEDIAATLQQLAYSDDKSLRANVVLDVFNWTDGSEDVVIQTSDIGKKVVVRDGDYDWTSQHTQGGLCLLDAIQSHNGSSNVLYFDKNILFGTTRNSMLSTIPVMLHALPWKMATGSAVAQYLVRHIFNSDYVNNGAMAYKKITLTDILSIAALQDLRLNLLSFDDDILEAVVKVETLCGGSNVGEKYSAELDNTALWKATNAETGAAIDINTVTYQPLTKSFLVRLLQSDPDLPVDGTVLLDLQAPSVLSAANVEGYESTGPLELVIVGS